MNEISSAEPTPEHRRGRRPGLRAAASGAVAAAVGMAAAELLSGVVPGVPSLIIAVGSLVIALQPPGAKDFVANLFGTNDKAALNVAVVVGALLIAAVVGIVGRRSFRRAAVAFAAFGALGFVGAVYAEFEAPVPALLSAVVAVAAGLFTLRALLGLAEHGQASAPGDTGAGLATGVVADPTGSVPDWGRRRFILASLGLLASAVVGGTVGRFLLDRQHPTGTPASARLPATAETVPPFAADQSLSAPGLTPIVMPNDRFYRIDTALLVPQLDAAAWELRVTGMVDHPLTFTYQDLLAMPLFEQYVTLACVSNPVGGDLVGNALWTGVRLKQILASAGIQPGATQIVGRSVDGFTVGFPTSWALDPSREPMVAVGMNRAPLPAEHGFPARLIVPGLYGYVSATKWLAEIELTTREAFDAYWVPLGWAKDGPILTQSRIDHPQDGADLPAGLTDIDGIAWAPDRGVMRVEGSIDGGPWQQTEMSRAISKATWVQWMLRWQATPGRHTIEVRATDGTGTVQTAERTDPAPDGARGHDQVQVTVH